MVKGRGVSAFGNGDFYAIPDGEECIESIDVEENDSILNWQRESVWLSKAIAQPDRFTLISMEHPILMG